MKIDPCRQQLKCRTITNDSSFWRYKVYANIHEVLRVGGVKRQWGCRKRKFSAFSMAIFGYFRDEASVIIWRYAVRRRLFSDPKMHDLE